MHNPAVHFLCNSAINPVYRSDVIEKKRITKRNTVRKSVFQMINAVLFALFRGQLHAGDDIRHGLRVTCDGAALVE